MSTEELRHTHTHTHTPSWSYSERHLGMEIALGLLLTEQLRYR